MASDQAHRLVEVSLNKIQSARGKRTGLNLHRSLLVSSVLFKAKTAIIMAKYHMRCDYDSRVSEPEDEEEEEEEDEFEEPQDSQEQIVEQQPEDDAQIVPDVDYCPEIQDSEQDIHELEDNKENSPPQVNYNEFDEKVSAIKESEKNSKCNRCLKRRLTEVESAVESITKKQCTDEDNCENNNVPSSFKQEPMDCAPINTLVDSFSCGFSGLLCARQGYNGQNERSDAHNQDSHVQGLSDAFSTCSTHIKDSFETLSAPIMLSV